MTIYHGISLILFALIFLIVGMIKPKWILIWMDNPTRLMIAAIAMVLFMIGSVLFGEGTKAKKIALAKEQASKIQPAAANSGAAAKDKPEDTPKPAAPAVAPPPAQAPTTSANDLRP
jgi:predicted tellurium resistance membrane protein TerC